VGFLSVGSPVPPAFALNLRPAAALQEGPLNIINMNSVAQGLNASGQADYFLAYFPTGRVVTSITFKTGTTASTGLTHSWAAIYNGVASPALLAQSADNTTAEWTVSSTRTFTGGGLPFTITAAGFYYIALSVTVSTTMPTHEGNTVGAQAGINAAANGLHFIDTVHTGLLGVATATATNSGTAAGYLYWYVS
jgi:hypothetical protein